MENIIPQVTAVILFHFYGIIHFITFFTFIKLFTMHYVSIFDLKFVLLNL